MKGGRVSKIVRVVVGIAVVQGLAIAIYVGVENSRGQGREVPFQYETLRSNPGVPDVQLARPGGATRTLTDYRGKPVLLHFWATWCPPCREELPGLIALGDELRRSGRGELVAVTVDNDWESVRAFFGSEPPPVVYQDSSGRAAKAYDVSTLPDTYLLGTDGVPILRFGGARDWRTEAAREVLEKNMSSR